MALTYTVEAIFEHCQNLQDEVRKALNKTAEKAERIKLKSISMKLSTMKPMNAKGYFEISKGTITSMLSVR